MTQRPPTPRHPLFALCYDFAARWDETRMAPLREEVAGAAEGRVLELGCGTGANLPYYRWVRIESVDATEPDPFMLRRARRKAEGMPPYAREKLTITQAPAEALPFPDEHFDTVTATLVLCTVRDLEPSLAEIRRVLKPRGEFRLLEHIRAEGRSGRIQDFVQPLYGRLAAGCHLGRRTEDAIKASGFRLEVVRRTKFGPLFPAFTGVATRGD